MAQNSKKSVIVTAMQSSPAFQTMSADMQKFLINFFSKASDKVVDTAISSIKTSNSRVKELEKKYPVTEKDIAALEAEAKRAMQNVTKSSIYVKKEKSRLNDQKEQQAILDELKSV